MFGYDDISYPTPFYGMDPVEISQRNQNPIRRECRAEFDRGYREGYRIGFRDGYNRGLRDCRYPRPTPRPTPYSS